LEQGKDPILVDDDADDNKSQFSFTIEDLGIKPTYR
jgi:hypothetical protein